MNKTHVRRSSTVTTDIQAVSSNSNTQVDDNNENLATIQSQENNLPHDISNPSTEDFQSVALAHIYNNFSVLE